MKTPIKLSRNAVILIILGNFAVLVLMTLVFLCYYCRRYCRNGAEGKAENVLDKEKMAYSSYSRNISQQLPCEDRGRLVFLHGPKQFEVEDLLRASAEMLGKGSFGSAYRAALEDSSVVVVKRVKDAFASSRKEFEQHMQLLGSLKHVNLVSLRAYYYAKDEKLLVYDYLPNGSLYSLLHGNRGPNRTPLDWTRRLKIALDAALGLAYLHRSGLIHGNVKSSNILLDKHGNACVADFCLMRLVNPSIAATRSAGYRAPEQIDNKKASQKADIYSFGVVLLELLTGKSPAQNSLQDEGDCIDLPKWAQSVVREEWTVEVFDLELLRYENIEEEMVAMLQIALVCACGQAEQRPKMSHVVKMIYNITSDRHQFPFNSPPSPSPSNSPLLDAASH
ncbi:hypothetical protein SUGI_0015410 [Cryptomeria japonica]|uniref:probable leucine-rich repeat receptor-like protein kinase At1g68400 n=1 Tax=Cryptomeria japonica TaxID=3369 RepID=UPI002408A65E|nr:probable leucine-rich repeat receptor-like protein kinase At1g68400 [Cryptomeria japonica]GLJ05288.1 hypothetical protein SUGI_0015410 [Cryptomeria japonica]